MTSRSSACTTVRFWNRCCLSSSHISLYLLYTARFLRTDISNFS